MNHSANLEALRQEKTKLLKQISSFPDFRPGSLVGRYRKCGKPRCHCAQPDSPGHGPSWSLTRTVKGKTVTKIIPEVSIEITREHIDGYHRFQKVVRNLVETNVKICDAKLESSESQGDGQNEVEKKG